MHAIEKIFLRRGKLLRASPEDRLLVRGSPAKLVYFVKSGQILLHSSSQDGREIGFEIVRSGHLFGFAASVSGHSFLDATALTASDLLVLKLDALEKALKDDIKAALDLLYYMTEQLFRRTRQAEGLALYSLRGRLARWLMSLAQEQHHGDVDPDIAVRLDFNQKLIAAMAGVSRETVNRQFHNWIRSGIIAIEGKELRILKPTALAELAEPVDDIPVPRGAVL